MAQGQPIRVVLVDDHRRVHEAVSILLNTVDDIELVGEAANGREAVRLCETLRPDVVLMDVVMPEMDGIAATRSIHQRFPAIKVLVLSSFTDHASVHEMLRSGACGYVTKGSLTQDMISTIRATHSGQAVFSADVAPHLLQASSAQGQPPPDLTDRELEVLGLMAEGLNNPQIAHQLAISPSTVKFHITNILDKLGVETRAEALVISARRNLI